MSHQYVDGTLVVAKLKRSLLGGAIYADVTVRDREGGRTNLGTILAADAMRHAMVPGRSGRFYFHDLLGSKGVHGFRPLAGKASAHFPRRWEVIGWALGSLNLLTALSWLLLDGSFAIWAGSFGMVGIVMALLFRSERGAAMRAYRADEARAPGLADLRAAAAPI